MSLARNALTGLIMLSLTACNHAGQNRYDERDVGQISDVMFGTVLAVRHIDIQRQNTGVGAASGMAAGAIGGSYIGRGGGSLGAMLAGMLVGGIAGHLTEQAINNDVGMEYTIRTPRGTISIAQNMDKSDQPIAVGSCVMVQSGGSYERVLPAPGQCRHRKQG